MAKIRDSYMAAIVAGGIATVVQMAISWSLYLLGVIDQNPSLFHARILTDSANPGPGDLLLGIFSNLVAGMLFALVIVYLLRLTGTDHALLKGAFTGLANAMLQFIVLARLHSEPRAVLPSAVTKWHLFIVYALWGIITAHIARSYAEIRIIHLSRRPRR